MKEMDRMEEEDKKQRETLKLIAENVRARNVQKTEPGPLNRLADHTNHCL